MQNIFNNVPNAPVSTAAVEAPKTSEQASVEGNRLKWFETPLTFILVVTSLLVVVHFVERKV